MLIYSYNPHSQGARALSQALGIRRIRHEGSRFTGRRRPTVINWGASQLPPWSGNCVILNAPEAVGRASNKLSFFRAMPAHLTPQWTTDRAVAHGWIREGTTVVQRTVLQGHSGQGIILADDVGELVGAPLYVKYVPKKDEYRVHVCNGEIIDLQRKAKRNDVPKEEANWQVRNLAGGFIYQRQDVQAPQQVQDVALAVMEASGLVFGAVDIIWNRKNQLALALEINTAPGLEGTTIQSYANAFRKLQI